MIDWNGNKRLDPTDIGISIASGLMGDRNTYDAEFEDIWQNIASLQGETFFTVKGKPFTYKVKGNKLYPIHISSSVRKKDFQKAFDLGYLKSPSQLSDEHIIGASYVYAILTDERVKAH